MRAQPLALALVAFSLPLAALGGVVVNQIGGTLGGTGVTPSHDFPVKATAFDLTISDPDVDGLRLVRVRVPVDAIDTESGMRDSHMLRTIFAGWDEPGKGEVVFEAHTASALAPGAVRLEGELSILGAARPQIVTATITGAEPRRIQGSATVDLASWNTDMPGMGPMKVSPQVAMTFDVALPVLDAPAVN